MQKLSEMNVENNQEGVAQKGRFFWKKNYMSQCTILGQISSVAEGLSPLKTRESCSISKSPVLNKNKFMQGANYFFVAIF